ncbi:MAG: hypothetical protein M3257_04745 [Actinomycetota bacterium]|nr:hypothetical protein [Actinomycetota bacterium]
MVVTAIVITGFPALRPNAVEAGTRYIESGITWKAFALALVGGTLITLMTTSSTPRNPMACAWCRQLSWVSCWGRAR